MLLADFHVHTTWSDGTLPLSDVVDLFGRSGHDVIAITDHIVNSEGLLARSAHQLQLTLDEARFQLYLEDIEREAARASREYGMIVIAGAELTQNSFNRNRAAHVLALGIDHYISADGSVDEMLQRARRSAEVIVACHPNEQSEWFANTFCLWNRRKELAGLIDLWEVACRWDLFPQVARAQLPFIGNSDFHELPHLYAWKTVLRCDKEKEAILDALKNNRGIALTQLTHDAQFDPLMQMFSTGVAQPEVWGEETP